MRLILVLTCPSHSAYVLLLSPAVARSEAAPRSKKGHKELHPISKHSLPWVPIDNQLKIQPTMAALSRPRNTFTATSWCAFTARVVKLSMTRKLLSRYNVNKDHATEFILYYVMPFAARHGLPMDKELDDYLSVVADYLLDMEDGAEPSTVSLLAQVAGMEACTRSTPDYLGFYAFVHANFRQDLVNRECEIVDDAMQGIDDFLVTMKGQF